MRSKLNEAWGGMMLVALLAPFYLFNFSKKTQYMFALNLHFDYSKGEMRMNQQFLVLVWNIKFSA